MKEIDMTATGKINAVLEHFRDGATAPSMDTVLEVLDFARIGAAVQPRPPKPDDKGQFIGWYRPYNNKENALEQMLMIAGKHWTDCDDAIVYEPEFVVPFSAFPKPQVKP